MINIHTFIPESLAWNFLVYNIYITLKMWPTCTMQIVEATFLHGVRLCQQMPLKYSNNSSKPFTSCSSSSVQEEEIMATLLGSESPYTGGKRRNCNNNIVTKFTASKITGQGFSRGTQVRKTMHILTVKMSECWSTETRDLRLQSSPKMKTLSCGVDWRCVPPPVSLVFTVNSYIMAYCKTVSDCTIGLGIMTFSFLADKKDSVCSTKSVQSKLRFKWVFCCQLHVSLAFQASVNTI